jgi:hypothetical protein
MAFSRPLDLEHLSRQTMGDRALEQEVLAMFSRQLAAIRDTISAADDREKARLAHALKGRLRRPHRGHAGRPRARVAAGRTDRRGARLHRGPRCRASRLT